MEDCTISETIKDIQIIEQKQYEHGEWKIDKIKVTHPFPLPKQMCIGIDPGTTNLGVCVFIFNQIITYRVRFKRDKNPVVRMVNTKNILSYLINYNEFDTKACVEGASYGDIYRQVELAEIRAACVFWSLEHGIDVKIAQPSEIRKAVLGNGNIKGKELWKGILSGDAADALVCCYFAGQTP